MFGFFMDEAYIAFYTFCVSVLMYYFLHIYYKKSKEDANNIIKLPGIFAFALPICILIIFLTSLIPVSSKPIEWKWMDSKLQKAYNNFTFKFGNKGKLDNIQEIGVFSLASIGFGDSNSLGGNIKLDDTKVLEVESEKRIYLRGRSKNYYDNNNWTLVYETTMEDNSQKTNNNTKKKYYTSPKSLYGEKLVALLDMAYPNSSSQHSEFFDDFLSVLNINVTYHNINTPTIFTPLNPYVFDFHDTNIKNDGIHIDTEDTLIYLNPLEKDFSYSLEYLFFDTNSNVFENTLRQSYPDFYATKLKKILKEMSDYIINHTSDYFEKNNVLDINETLPDAFPQSSNFTTPQYHDHLEAYKSSNDVLLKYVDTSHMSDLELLIASSFTKLNESDLSNQDIRYYVSSNSSLEYISEFTNLIHQYLFSEFSRYNFDFLFFTKYVLSVNNALQDLMYEYYTYRLALVYTDFVYNNYTFVPGSLPDRVQELAYEITKNEENNFDKVKSLETHLAQNYYYTLSPGDVPEGRDFVDYFLFDSKEGYCTYFATSMAILTRCIGIPSRYVEGYRLPYLPTEGNLYEVRNSDAHAWVEVFFEGVGWVVFEPTAIYNYTFYNPGSTPPPYLLQQTQQGYRPSNYQPGNSSGTNRKPTMPNEETPQPLNIRLILTILLVVAIFPLIISLNLLIRKIKLKRIYKLNARECVIKLFEKYLKHLKILKKPVLDGETPFEYAKRIDAYGCFHPYSFSEITTLFVKARYSQQEITEEEKEIVYNFYKHVLDATRKKLKFIYFFTTF
jgi:hypothetical protein